MSFGIKLVLPTQHLLTLVTLLALTMNWQAVHARECQKDEYYDLHTGNCDPCAPLCAVTNCSNVCPDFKIPESDEVSVSSSDGGLDTKDLLAVILVPILVLVLAFVACLIHKKGYKKIKDWCLLRRTHLPIQESQNDDDIEDVV